MAILLDAGILYAYYDRSDDWHRRAVRTIEDHAGALVVPAPVSPEADHLIGRRLGVEAQRTFYRGLADGAYFVADLPRDRLGRVLALNEQFPDLRLGFVDAAIVAIGEAIDLRRIATTDRRHFEPLARALKLTLVP
ncbi:MAG TPA: PIN domain-containing protein [Methylomirabilota bacterium]